MEFSGVRLRNDTTSKPKPTASSVNTLVPFSSQTEFAFPFRPYMIQKDFMKELYRTIEDGCVGIFESPTGTVTLSNMKLPLKLIGEIAQHNLQHLEVAERSQRTHKQTHFNY